MNPRAKVQAWIGDAGLTQAQAAARLGVSQGAVSQLLRSTTGTPSLALAQAIERETTDWAQGPIRTEEWLVESHRDPSYSRTEGK
jgi:transcriptional regulator with XRE-family HTH domain